LNVSRSWNLCHTTRALAGAKLDQSKTIYKTILTHRHISWPRT